MKCQECGQEATVRVTDIVEGRPQVRHLCEQHGKEYAVPEVSCILEPLPEGDVRVTVEVTRSQIERGETVFVKLPDGRRGAIVLPREMKDGDPLGGSGASFFGEFRDEPDQLFGRPPELVRHCFR